MVSNIATLTSLRFLLLAFLCPCFKIESCLTEFVFDFVSLGDLFVFIV